MTNTNEELLPCPFCGGEAIHEKHHNNTFDGRKLMSMSCAGCGAQVIDYDVGHRIKWNRRTPAERIEGE